VAQRAAYKILEEQLTGLSALNPDVAQGMADDLYELADRVGSRYFIRFQRLTESLISSYCKSRPKQAEQSIMCDYFARLEEATEAMNARGELVATTPLEDSADAVQSVALVTRYHYSSLDWCRLQSNADIPQSVMRAVEACRRRNELLSSVIEVAFCIMLRINKDRTVAWQLGFLQQNRGTLDPDVVRDVVKSWHTVDDLPAAALEWALRWSAEENLQRQWPEVVNQADCLLRNHALKRWAGDPGAKASGLDHLRMLLARNDPRRDRLIRWLNASISDLGERVHFFVDLSDKKKDDPVAPGNNTDWRSAALLRELIGIEAVFVPILVLADLVLASPDGGHRFAMALFGLAGTGLSTWEHELEQRQVGKVLSRCAGRKDRRYD